MERIVNILGERVHLRGTVLEDCWEVVTREANGHKELSFKNMVMWEETGEPCPPVDGYPWYDAEDLANQEAMRAQELEERREKQREKNAQRAKSKCRWIIKSQGLNELLTLTYRENQQDRDLCKKHFKEWVRRMKAALGGKFIYCASFERQERGAMHVHVACHKLPNHGTRKGQKIKAWKLGTEIWRSIIGENNGLCFVGGKTRHGGQRRNLSLAKLAAYVSKYIMKDYRDAPLESNRYSRSNGLEVPKAVKMSFQNLSFNEMVALAFHCGDGDVIVSHRVTRDRWSGGRYWLVTEPMASSAPMDAANGPLVALVA
jgi:hypothetical protein